MSRTSSRSCVDITICWLEARDRPAQQFAVAKVQQGGRLVEHQHRRFHGQDGRQGHELPFAAGEFVNALVRQRQQPEPVEDRLGGLPALPCVADGSPQRQFNILPSGGHDQAGRAGR